jgi:hypothetical protein
MGIFGANKTSWELLVFQNSRERSLSRSRKVNRECNNLLTAVKREKKKKFLTG